jgi:DNA-binding cell septation regulator SpoVG
MLSYLEKIISINAAAREKVQKAILEKYESASAEAQQ